MIHVHHPLPLAAPARTKSNISASSVMRSTPSGDSDDNMLQTIMDQAVLLYSNPSVNCVSDNQIQQDIRELRQRDAVRLVEDTAVIIERLKNERESLVTDGSSSSAIVHREQFPSVQEVARKFDDAIMDAATNGNMNNAVILALAMEHYRLQTAIDTTEETANELQARLENLRVLVAPTSSRRLYMTETVAQPQLLNEENKELPVQTEQVEKVQESIATNQRPETNTPNFAATDSVPVTGGEVIAGEKDIPSAKHETAGEGAMEYTETSDEDAINAIAAVVSMGAVAAALMTKVPVFAAGAALGPVMSSAVSALNR